MKERYEIEISWNEAGVSTATFGGPGCPTMSITPAPAELLTAKNFVNSQNHEAAQAAE